MQNAFNFEAGVEAKTRGMEQAANNKKSLLVHARQVAVYLAAQKGEITADDVQRKLADQGISLHALGNAAGSLFIDKKVWEWTGRLKKSERVHAHGNLLRVWRLK